MRTKYNTQKPQHRSKVKRSANFCTKGFVFVCVLLMVLNCKNVAKTLEKAAEGKSKRSVLRQKNIIQKHYNSHKTFQTLSGKVRVDYDFSGDGGSHVVSFRMLKDSVIWVSAPFDLIKVKLTPKYVDFYNRLGHTYFSGTYKEFSRVIGTELSFGIAQNILLGYPANGMEYVKKADSTPEAYTLFVSTPENIKGRILIDAKSFHIYRQEYRFPDKRSALEVSYGYRDLGFPEQVELLFLRNAVEENRLKLIYKSFDYDRNISFPYKVPKGFSRISL